MEENEEINEEETEEEFDISDEGFEDVTSNSINTEETSIDEEIAINEIINEESKHSQDVTEINSNDTVDEEMNDTHDKIIEELVNEQDSYNVPLTKTEVDSSSVILQQLEENPPFVKLQDSVESLDETLVTDSNHPDSEIQDSTMGSTLGSCPSNGGSIPPLGLKKTKPTVEINITSELRGLLTGYGMYIVFENKEDSISIIKDVTFIYKLLCFSIVKSKKKDIQIKLQTMKNNLEQKGVLEAISNYNDYLSRRMNFGMSRVKRKLDVFVNNNMKYLLNLIQFWVFVQPFRGRKDQKWDTMHGMPAATGDEMEQHEIEKGEGIINIEGPFKIDEEGEVIQFE